ncbi:MAG TPA: aspartate/glutamate racemase family protein [Candidatus Caccovivens faecavium]|nr:aspartate/glutamate racemase family protein [Candidatus Caccovivens faecavium]
MKNVLLIDSGSGGVNILKECVKVCPYSNYLLYCDHENLPYGEKSKAELIEITESNLQKIHSFFKFDIVIFACNTLTATVIDEMREKYKNITFIGTVPAIKPALNEFKEKDILLIATKTTIKNNKLIGKYRNSEIKFKALSRLAPLIDEHLDELDLIYPYLKRQLSGDFKALVLGCTHYKAVEKIIKEIKPNVKIFDSANGVARQLLHFIQGRTFGYQVQIYCENSELRAKFWWYYNN